MPHCVRQSQRVLPECLLLLYHLISSSSQAVVCVQSLPLWNGTMIVADITVNDCQILSTSVLRHQSFCCEGICQAHWRESSCSKASQRKPKSKRCGVLRSAAKCCKGMNYDETCENWVVEVVEGDHVWARCKRQNNLLRQPTAKQSGTAWNSLERSGTHFRSARVSKQACKGPMEPAEYRRRQARGLIERVINCDCMTDMTVRLSMKYCSITAWWNKNK